MRLSLPLSNAKISGKLSFLPKLHDQLHAYTPQSLQFQYQSMQQRSNLYSVKGYLIRVFFVACWISVRYFFVAGPVSYIHIMHCLHRQFQICKKDLTSTLIRLSTTLRFSLYRNYLMGMMQAPSISPWKTSVICVRVFSFEKLQASHQ